MRFEQFLPRIFLPFSRTFWAAIIASILLHLAVASTWATPTYSAFRLDNHNSTSPDLVSLGSLGDLDGNGHPDLGAGMPWYDLGSTTDVGILYRFATHNVAPSWSITGTSNDDLMTYGYRDQPFITLGDVNADGVPDFAVAIPRFTANCVSVQPTPGGKYTGTVTVFSGSTHTALYSVSGNINGGFAFGLTALGDLDGDGVNDFVVNTLSNRQRNNDHCDIIGGELIVYSGRTGTIIPNHTVSTARGVGYFVTNVGDVNHDGVEDFAADSASGVTVYSGADSSVIWNITLAHPIGAIARLGDINSDGYADFAVSLFTDNVVKVYSGIDASVLRTISITASTGQAAAIAGVGDIDGDGISDLVIMADGGYVFGQEYVQLVSGASGATISKTRFKHLIDFSYASVVPLGLVDGDSIPDFGLAGGVDHSAGTYPANSVFVFLSGTQNPEDPIQDVDNGDNDYYLAGNAVVGF